MAHQSSNWLDRPVNFISVRLPLLVVGAFLAPLLLALTAVFFLSRQQLENQADQQLNTIALAQIDKVDSALEGELLFLRQVAMQPAIQQSILAKMPYPVGSSLDVEEEAELFAQWQENGSDAFDANPGLQKMVEDFQARSRTLEGIVMGAAGDKRLLLADWRGSLIAGNYEPGALDMRYQPWWQAVVTNKEDGYLAQDSKEHATIQFAVPIRHPEDSDAVIGVLAAILDEAQLFNGIEQEPLAEGVGIILIDENGSILFANNEAASFSDAILNVEPSQDEVRLTLDPAGVAYQYHTALSGSSDPRVRGLGWQTITVMKRSEVLQPIGRNVMPALAIAGIVGLGLTVALYFGYLRPFVRDLTSLREGAQAILDGKSPTKSLKRNDELGLFSVTFQRMNTLLQDQIFRQEQTILERTDNLARQTKLLQAAAKVAQAANASLDLSDLMATTVNLIPEALGFYHASIFLLDAEKRYAIVRESTGEVGQILKSRPHMLPVDEHSTVGLATSKRKPYLIHDVTEDFSHFNNPLLPNTRSEIALPLIVQDELLGALDVQSKEINAFAEEDVANLQLMADQVAAAIFNARTFEQVEKQSIQRQQIVQLNQELSQIEGEQTIIDLACNQITKWFHFDAAHIAAVIEKNWKIVGSSSVVKGLKAPMGLERPINSGLIGQVLTQEGAAINAVRDESSGSFYDASLPAFNGEAAVPIYQANQLYGALCVYSAQPGVLESTDLELLAFLSEAVGNALLNYQQSQQIEENLAELNFLYYRVARDEDDVPGQGEFMPATDTPSNIPAPPTQFNAPLFARGRPIGEIEIDENGQSISEEEQAFIAAISDHIGLTIENSRLFNQTQNRLKETDALYNMATLLSSTLDEAQLYERIPYAVGEMLNLSRCVVSGWDVEKDAIYNISAYAYGENASQVFQRRAVMPEIPLSNTPHIKKALQQGVTHLCHIDDESIAQSERDQLRAYGQKTFMQTPLLFGNETLNILFLFRDETKPDFTDRERQLAKTIANQIAIAINNARLATESKRQVTQLSILNRISERFSQASSLDALLNAAQEELMPLTGATNMAILTLNQDRSLLRYLYRYEFGLKSGLSAESQPIPVNGSLPGYLIQKGEAINLNSTNADAPSAKLPTLTLSPISGAWAGFPLIAGNDKLGVLQFEHGDDYGAFADLDLELMETISASLAIAIKNELQVVDIRQSQETTEALYQVTSQINLAQSVGDILKTFSVSPVFAKAEQAAVYLYEEPRKDEMPAFVELTGKWNRSEEISEEIIVLPTARFPLMAQFERNRPFLSPNIYSDPRVDEASRTWLGKDGNFNALGVFPLIAGEAWIGFLMVQAMAEGNSLPFLVRQTESMASQAAIAIQGQLLLRQTQTALSDQAIQSNQLQVAAQVAAAASAILDIDELMDAGVSLVQNAFGLSYAGIYMLNPSENKLALRAGTDETGKQLIQNEHALYLDEQSLPSQAAARSDIQVSNDTDIDERWQATPTLEDTRAEAALPLRVRGRAIGILSLHSRAANLFTPQFVQVLQTITDQLAIAIENAELLTNTQHMSHQLQIAAEVANASSAILSLDLLLQRMVGLIRDQFGLYYVGVFLREGDFAVLRAGSGNAGRIQVEAGHKLPIQSRLSKESGSMVERAISESQAVVEQDVTKAAVWAPNHLLPLTQSELALPLRSRGQVIGALTAQSQSLNGFPEENVTVLQILADQLGVAVENAGLFSDTERGLSLQAKLFETSQKIATANDVDGIFNAIIDFAAESTIVEMAGVLFPDDVDDTALNFKYLWQHQFGLLPATDPLFPNQITLTDFWRSPNIITAGQNQTEDRLPAADWSPFKQFGISSIAIVPLLVNAEWIGSLVLGKVNSQPVSDEDLQFFRTLSDQGMVILANQRLYEESEGLYQVSRSLAQTVTIDDALEAAVNAVYRYAAPDQCRFVWYDKQKGVFPIVEAVESGLANIPFSTVSNDPLLAMLQQGGQPLLLSVNNAEDQVAELHLRRFGALSAYIVPASSQGDLIGYLALDSKKENALFDLNSRNFAQSVVEQLNKVIENTRLLEDTLHRAQDLVNLNQFGARISSVLELADLGEILQAQIQPLIPHELSVIALYDQEQSELHPLQLTINNESVEVNSTIVPDAPLTTFLENGNAVIASAEHPLAQSIARQLNAPPQPSSIWAPLRLENNSIGFITFQSSHSNQYHENDLQLARGIANQTSLAISNARLFNRTQENIEELRKLLQVSQAANSSINARERAKNVLETLSANLYNADIAIYVSTHDEERFTRYMSVGNNAYPKKIAKDNQYNWDTLHAGNLFQNMKLNRSAGNANGDKQNPRYQIIVPLLLGNRLIGILDVLSDHRQLFENNSMRLLLTLTGSLATTIESGRLFDEIEAANEQLTQIDMLKTQFLANMSHELRTPLNSIIGFSRLILRGIDGPITKEQEEDLTSIHSSGKHLLRLINDVLDMSKIEAGKMALAIDEVNLEKEAKIALDTIYPLLQNKPIELIKEIDDDLPIIMGDESRIRQILLNLLSNAAKFTTKGSITLSIKQIEPNAIKIEVRDTGRGIEDEDFEKLFRPFEQVDSSPTRQVGGTGLGLPITKSLVTMHNGEIWIESKEGEGSTFHVMLPINKDILSRYVTYEVEGS